MCSGDQLIADFVAGTDTHPNVPTELEPQLTTTASGVWVVWAYKLARPSGDLFVPITGGPGYPADAAAVCRIRLDHRAPDPACTCGFHALSSSIRGYDFLLRLPAKFIDRGVVALTVALSGRVLAFERPGEKVLWRAERQTVVRVERPVPLDAEVAGSKF